MLTYQREMMLLGLSEGLALGAAHCQELRPERRFDPDVPRLQDMFAEGSLRVFSARMDGRMIGYAAFVVTRHLLFRSETFAHEMGFFIERGSRGRYVLPMLRFAEAELFADGVTSILLSEQADHPVSAIFSRLGYRIAEHGWMKDASQHNVRRAA